MNEETIIEKTPVVDGQEMNKENGSAWKHVTIGGVSGILMGAGLVYARQAFAATEANAGNDDAEAAPAEEAASDASLPVASLHNDLSFGEAFAAARAEVGAGGVFLWHGGIYNTYTAEEWNAMTAEQKSDFAHQVNPEVSVHNVTTPTNDHPDVVVQHSSDDVQIVDQNNVAAAQDDDVHIVGYANVEGHLAVGIDVNGDGQADVAIIDVDDNGELSSPDIVIDNEGNYATVGEIMEGHDSNMEAYNHIPDVAEESQSEDFLIMDM